MRTPHVSRCSRVKRSPRHHFVLTSISFLDVVAKHPSLFFSTSLIFINCSISRPSASSTSMGRRFWENSCEPAHWSGMSGRMANPASNTGYEHNLSNLFSYTHADQLPWQPPRFLVPGRRYRDLHHRRSRRFVALRSVQQRQANSSLQSFVNVRTLKSLGTDEGHVLGRTSLQETGGNLGQNLLQQRFVVHCQKGRERESETLTLCIRWKTWKVSKKSLKGKLTRPSEERWWLSENCTKLTLRLRQEIGKREIPAAFQEINQELESQRFQLHQGSRWADQSQRVKISLCGELGLRNRLCQENHAGDCHEIEELRRLCCALVERDKREVTNCLCNKGWIPQPWVKWWLRFRNHRTKPCPMQETSAISGSTSGATLVPDRASTILSLRTLPRFDAGLPRDFLNGTGITGKVVERALVHEGFTPLQSSTLRNFWHILL